MDGEGNSPPAERPNMAYNTRDHCLVSDREAMFGNIPCIEPEKAAAMLREKLDVSMKKGHLKAENTEATLVDIRHAVVQCDKAKNERLREADQAFTELIKALKLRKEQVLSHIDNFFIEERRQIQESENYWREKQTICNELLRFASSKDTDIDLLKNAAYVEDGLKKLEEKHQFKEIKMINSLDTVMHFKEDNGTLKADVSHEELKRNIMDYVQVSENKSMQYKC